MVNLVICNQGKLTKYFPMSPEKAYWTVNEFSNRIHNGNLSTVKDDFVRGVNTMDKVFIDFGKGRFAFLSESDETTREFIDIMVA